MNSVPKVAPAGGLTLTLRQKIIPVLAWLISTLPLTAAAGSSGELLLVSSFAIPTNIKAYDALDGSLIGYFGPEGSEEMRRAHSIRLGPDGLLYLSSYSADKVTRVDPNTGQFVDTFVSSGTGGIDGVTDALHGADGHLYVASYLNGSVSRFDGETGEYIDEFIPAGHGGLAQPELMEFGPDGHLYIGCRGQGVMQFNGETGEFMRIFAAHGINGVDDPHAIIFGPDGKAYVSMFGNGSVHRFDVSSGAYIDEFIPPGSGGLTNAHGMAFGVDGNLYVTSFGSAEVMRYDGVTGEFIDVFISPAYSDIHGPTHLIFLPVPDIGLNLEVDLYERTFALSASGAEAGETVYFFEGDSVGATPITGCETRQGLIANASLIGTGEADAQGIARLTGSIPAGLDMQNTLVGAVIPDSCKRSGILKAAWADDHPAEIQINAKIGQPALMQVRNLSSATSKLETSRQGIGFDSSWQRFFNKAIRHGVTRELDRFTLRDL